MLWKYPNPVLIYILILMSTTILEEVGSIRRYHSLKERFQKVRHAGKYKQTEKVVKKIEHDHPCKLTKTSVKVILVIR